MSFDWAGCVERNRDILIRIIADMFVLARIVPGEVIGSEPFERTLPRYVWRAVMLILVPAEAAMRRLIIIAARGLAFEPLVTRTAPAGTALPAAADASENTDDLESADAAAGSDETAGSDAAPRTPVFNMFDPMKSFWDYWGPELDPGSIKPFPSELPDPVRCAPVGAVRLWQRLQALHNAVQDMPGSVQRYLRFLALCAYAIKTKTKMRPQRLSPMRPGYAPGFQKNRHAKSEAQLLLDEVHSIAFKILSPPKPPWV